MESESPSLDLNIAQFLRGVKIKHLARVKQARSMLASTTDVHKLVNGVNTDITLKALDGNVQAHRHMLVSYSSVFKAMVENHTSTTPEEEPLELAMTVAALKVLLVLLYGANNQLATWQVFHPVVNTHFHEIFDACRKFEIIQLVPTLHTALPGRLTHANYGEFYIKAFELNKICEERMGVYGYCCLHEQCCKFLEENPFPSSDAERLKYSSLLFS